MRKILFLAVLTAILAGCGSPYAPGGAATVFQITPDYTGVVILGMYFSFVQGLIVIVVFGVAFVLLVAGGLGLIGSGRR